MPPPLIFKIWGGEGRFFMGVLRKVFRLVLKIWAHGTWGADNFTAVSSMVRRSEMYLGTAVPTAVALGRIYDNNKKQRRTTRTLNIWRAAPRAHGCPVPAACSQIQRGVHAYRRGSLGRVFSGYFRSKITVTFSIIKFSTCILGQIVENRGKHFSEPF